MDELLVIVYIFATLFIFAAFGKAFAELGILFVMALAVTVLLLLPDTRQK